MKKFLFYFVIITSSVPGLPGKSNGQGVWIEQATGFLPTNNQFLTGGDNCIGYAKDNDQFMYFFDISLHQWTTADLGSPQNMHAIRGRGNVIMAYTDELLIGYSSLTSTFDIINFQGEPINPGALGMLGGYGCTEWGAFFVTDEFFYVFDTELGTWQSYAYILPEPFYTYGASFIKGDDYIGVILPQQENYIDYTEFSVMAYSLPNHAFAETNYGGPYAGTMESVIMSNGFVTMRRPVGVDSTYLTGYSSSDNQFLTKFIGSMEGDISIANSWDYPENYTKKTVAAYMLVLNADQNHNEKIYAYSTIRGRWDISPILIHDAQAGESDYLSISLGGTLAASSKVNFENDDVFYEIYDSETGGFHSYGPESQTVTNNGHTSEPVCANNVMMAHDSTHIWFYNPSLGGSFLENAFADMSTGYIVGDKFVAVNTWDLWNANPDILYIYNTFTGNTSIINVGNIRSAVYPHLSHDMFAFTADLGAGIYFYSSITDSYSYVSFQNTSTQYIDIREKVAVATSQNGLETYLYDANLNATTLVTFPFNSYQLGGNFILFINGQTIKGYNYTLQEFSNVEVNNLWGIRASDRIGLVWDNNQENFFAYNGFSASWVPLIPEGQSVYNNDAYGKTAVVVRDDRIYAFDPEIVTGIDKQANRPEAQLLQNYPNPFADYTYIEYTLTSSEHVSLHIFNLLGNEVTTLVDENSVPGKYRIRFETNKLPEGIYYYSLEFNGNKQTKKMVLMR